MLDKVMWRDAYRGADTQCEVGWEFELVHAEEIAKGSRLQLSWEVKIRREHIGKLKNGVFLDVTPCGSCKNRRFGGT
jgi:hypothetical protein